jgi:peptidoglycan/LPS O-acetylase OafA/YrhL
LVNTKFLDGTRFFLAFWVAVDHFYALMGGSKTYFIPVIGEYILLGSVPVNGFIMITGFLMTYHYYLRQDKEPYNKKSTAKNFWLRRVFRLYPVYVISILATYFLSKLISYHKHTVTSYINNTQNNVDFSTLNYPSVSDLISHITFTHGLIDKYSTSLLTPAWSLSLEMQYYLLFPLLFMVLFSTKKSHKLLFIAIPISALLYTVSVDLLGIYGTPGELAHFVQPSVILYRLSIFLYGMVLAGVVLEKLNPHFLWLIIICVFPYESTPTTILMGLITFFMFLDRLKEQDMLQAKTYKVLVFIRGIFSGRIANFGANISYSLYLTHWIILPFVFSFVLSASGDRFNIYETIFLAFIVYIVTCFLISYLLYKWIEEPFIKLGKHLIKNGIRRKEKQTKVKTA